MCSSTISDTANRLRKTRKKKSSAVPLSKRSHIGNLRRIRKQGKGRSSKRKGNRRCPFLFAPAAGAATSPPSADGESPAEVQRKTPRPLGANTPAAVRVPRSAGAEKGVAPSGRTRQRQFECPAQPVQRKEPPVKGEPACGSSRPPLSRCRERSRPVRANTLTQFAHPAGSVQKKFLKNFQKS